MRSAALAFVACMVLLATSCARDGGNGAASGIDSTDAAANGQQNGARPATLLDTIAIEGMAEPMTMQLVESPASFPMQFTTYMPPDMQVEFLEDSAAVRFIAAFGGTAQPKAYVHMQQLADGAGTAMPADSLVALMLAGRSLSGVNLMQGAPRWASDGAGFSYTEAGERYTGTVAVRTEGATPVRLVIHMPSEYGDGMAPRVQVLLEHWRWADGTPLIP